jgi:putative methyltransferase (TIGR04325 family)
MSIDKFISVLKRFSLQIKSYGFSGNYKSWSEAVAKTNGYSDDSIFKKVEDATNEVISGKACYERDSVTFYTPNYDWFLITCLNHVFLSQGKLKIADFGGALGSIYHQHRLFLDQIPQLQWHVIEQDTFVAIGKKNFETEQLHFNESLSQASDGQPLDIIMFRCVLPYLEKPYEILQSAIDLKPAYILIDRNPFVDGSDRICIQKVPSNIVKSSYPAWFFNKQKMMDFMAKEYELVASDFDQDMVNIKSSYEGHLFKRKNS